MGSGAQFEARPGGLLLHLCSVRHPVTRGLCRARASAHHLLSRWGGFRDSHSPGCLLRAEFAEGYLLFLALFLATRGPPKSCVAASPSDPSEAMMWNKCASTLAHHVLHRSIAESGRGSSHTCLCTPCRAPRNPRRCTAMLARSKPKSQSLVAAAAPCLILTGLVRGRLRWKRCTLRACTSCLAGRCVLLPASTATGARTLGACGGVW